MQRILKSVAWKCHENQFTLQFSTYRNLKIASTLPLSACPPLSLPRRDPALTIARMLLRNLVKRILKSVAEKCHEKELALQFLGYQNLIILSKKRHLLCRIWNFSFLSEKRRFQFLCCFCVKSEIRDSSSGQTIVRNFKLKAFHVSFYWKKRLFRHCLRAISGLLLLTYFGLLCNFRHIFEPLVDAKLIETFDTRSDPGSERAFNVSIANQRLKNVSKIALQKLCLAFFL